MIGWVGFFCQNITGNKTGNYAHKKYLLRVISIQKALPASFQDAFLQDCEIFWQSLDNMQKMRVLPCNAS